LRALKHYKRLLITLLIEESDCFREGAPAFLHAREIPTCRRGIRGCRRRCRVWCGRGRWRTERLCDLVVCRLQLPAPCIAARRVTSAHGMLRPGLLLRRGIAISKIDGYERVLQMRTDWGARVPHRAAE